MAVYVPAVFQGDLQEPRAALRRILGGATMATVALGVVLWLTSGTIDWPLFGFAGVLWAAWSFYTTLYTNLAEPLGRFLMNQLTGNVALPVAPESIDDETARFERMLEQPLEPHHAILIGIRLAEIYRTHQRDDAKSAALLERLRARYPNAPELIDTARIGMPEPIDDQVARYERMLQGALEPHRAVLIGIRLAEMYRTHRHDEAKSNALLARLRAEYPDAPELAHAGSD